MVSFQEAGTMLDEACEALPQGIFQELNGGVNLLPEVRRGEDGSLILGLYHNNAMGRYIEIFYGSIAALYGDIPAERFRARLVKTLHHELTHHVEGLAGDRTLEHWDEAQELIGTLPLRGERILFVDEDDGALAPLCAALSAALAGADSPLRFASAGLLRAGALLPEAEKAARNAGAALTGHTPRALDMAVMAENELIFCMTLLQADELAERFPARDADILCLGETDLCPPKNRFGWGALVKRLRRECAQLIEDLTAEE